MFRRTLLGRALVREIAGDKLLLRWVKCRILKVTLFCRTYFFLEWNCQAKTNFVYLICAGPALKYTLVRTCILL